jgi:hypothetical protein
MERDCGFSLTSITVNWNEKRQQQHMEIVARQNVSNLEPMIYSEKKEGVVTKDRFTQPHQNPKFFGK